jgi:SanA protein
LNPRLKRRLRRGFVWGVFVFGLLVLGANRWVINSTDSYLYDNSALLPENEVGLVLGCSPYSSDGSANPQFYGRMAGAAELLKLGKVKRLILSGANPDSRYNEPRKMREALLDLGVKPDDMVLDYAGDSTFESVERAQVVFDLTRVTIITQRYHAYRALFLARKQGMSAVGYMAPIQNVEGHGFVYPPREVFARLLAILDLFLLRPEATHSSAQPATER